MTLDALLDTLIALRRDVGGGATLNVLIEQADGAHIMAPMVAGDAWFTAAHPRGIVVADVPSLALPPTPPRQCNGCSRHTLEPSERWMPGPVPDGEPGTGYEPAMCMRCAAMPEREATR